MTWLDTARLHAWLTDEIHQRYATEYRTNGQTALDAQHERLALGHFDGWLRTQATDHHQRGTDLNPTSIFASGVVHVTLDEADQLLSHWETDTTIERRRKTYAALRAELPRFVVGRRPWWQRILGRRP